MKTVQVFLTTTYRFEKDSQGSDLQLAGERFSRKCARKAVSDWEDGPLEAHWSETLEGMPIPSVQGGAAEGFVVFLSSFPPRFCSLQTQPTSLCFSFVHISVVVWILLGSLLGEKCDVFFYTSIWQLRLLVSPNNLVEDAWSSVPLQHLYFSPSPLPTWENNVDRRSALLFVRMRNSRKAAVKRCLLIGRGGSKGQ